MGKRKRNAALTLDDLGGVAAKKVSFIRADARAAVASGPSKSSLKSSLSSPHEPQWCHVSEPKATAMLQKIAAAYVSRSPGGGVARCGVVIGLNAVTRQLRRGRLRCVIMSREHIPALLLAHLRVLAQQQMGGCYTVASSRTARAHRSATRLRSELSHRPCLLNRQNARLVALKRT